MRALILLPLLAACTDGTSLTGEDIGVLRDGDAFTADEGAAPSAVAEPDFNNSPAEVFDDEGDASQANFAAICLGADEPNVGSELVATGGAGQIDVVHTGLWTSSTVTWQVEGVVTYDEDAGVGRIGMTYEEYNAGDPDAEPCLWQLAYTIRGVPPGEWTITARGDDDVVDVTNP